MGLTTRTSAADLLANISKAIRLEAEDCDEDEVVRWVPIRSTSASESAMLLGHHKRGSECFGY